MRVDTSWRRVVVAAVAMIIAAQLLSIANDVFLRQSDPSDVVLLGVLVVLALFLLRRSHWARWTTVVLAALGGVLGLAGFALLVAVKVAPGSWPALVSAVPALEGLRAALAAFIASPAFPLLAASVLVSDLLDLGAAGMLVFAPSVRSAFGTRATARGA